MSIRSHNLVLALITAGLLLQAAAVALAEPDGRALLRKAVESEPRARYQGTYFTEMNRPGGQKSARLVIKRNGLHGFRIQVLEPARLRANVMVDDGQRCVEQLPGSRAPQIGPSRAALPIMILFPNRPNLQMRAKNLAVNTLRKDRVIGREVWVVEVSGPRPNQPKRRLWLDAKRSIPLKSEVVAPSGEILYRSGFERITFKPEFGVEDFHVQRLAGGKRMLMEGDAISLEKLRSKAPFAVAVPDSLPPGFKLEEASLVRWGRDQVVRLRYSDGFAAFALYETPNARPPKMLPARVRSKNVGGVNITMVGNNLAPEKQQAIFDSVD